MLEGGPPRLRFSVILTAGLILAVSTFGIRDLARRTERRLTNQLPDGQTEITMLLDERLQQETNPNHLLALATRLAKTGELTLARQVLLAANRSYPSSRDSHVLLAWVLAQVGDLAEAKKALAIAARLDPLDPVVQELQAVLTPDQSPNEAQP